MAQLDNPVFISCYDPVSRIPKLVYKERYGRSPCLIMRFDDFETQELNWREKIAHYMSGTLSRFVLPIRLFDKRDADNIVRFLEKEAGFDKDIVVTCEYARKRSVAIGLFLKRHFRPGYELKIARVDCRPNRLVYRTLCKRYLEY